MAKIKPNFRSKRGSTRRIATKVIVHRTAERGNVAFEACIRMGTLATTPRLGHAVECAYGKNPRAAVANAMVQFGKAIRKRKGAFRGAR